MCNYILICLYLFISNYIYVVVEKPNYSQKICVRKSLNFLSLCYYVYLYILINILKCKYSLVLFL